jgi:hypothetical protein
MIARASFFVLIVSMCTGCGGVNDGPPVVHRRFVCNPQSTAQYDAAYLGSAFVVRKIFFGDSDRTGQPRSGAWKTYGEDIDGIISTKESHGECRRISGAPPWVREDGDEGIDNASGHMLVSWMFPLVSAPSAYASKAIEDGGRTPMFLVGNWPHGAEAARVVVGFAYAEKTSTPPRWDGSDIRSLAGDWTNGTGPSVSFPHASSCDGELVSGEATAALLLELPPWTTSPEQRGLRLSIRRAHVEMKVAPDGMTASGTISGIMVTEELVRAFDEFAGSISPELCGGSTYDAYVAEVLQASDILSDGSQDPNVDCNGISVGIGFEAVAATAGDIAPATDPPKNLCTP